MKLSLSRRAFVGGVVALGAHPTAGLARVPTSLIAGNYAQAGGPGLVPLAASKDGWMAGEAIGAIRNASFGLSRHGVRYLLDEQEQGALGVYDRGLRRLASFSTLGADPCHAALSPDGGMLAVANYSSGSLALWQLDHHTGIPVGDAQRIAHSGNGPDAQRQTGPHAHWVGFSADGRWLHAVDLGADAVFRHEVDQRAARIKATSIAYRAPAGSGPRHLARHPRLPIAYLVAELANTVTMLKAGPDGTFVAQASLSTLPADFSGSSSAAHIAINRSGTRLYVSNRGHDSIAVFAIAADGTLMLLQHVGSGGVMPRFFLLIEERGEMLVANQRSGNVAWLPLHKDGRLGAAVRGVAIPGVAFVSA